jgi:FkbM family methyltransferase
MIKRFLKELAERILNHKKYSETKKLLRQPRYQSGKSTLFKSPFYYVDASTFYYGYADIFLYEPYKFKSKLSDPLIIDCGANIGLGTIYFKQQYPDSKIIAFEPDPQIFKTLEKNIEINNLTDVTLVNKAVWINNDTIDFEVEGGFSGRINKYEGKSNIIKVETQRLNDLLTQNISFLKIDIEGAEFEVIKDCSESLHFVEHLFIEYHSHISETQKLGELLTLLTNAGFRYHIKEAYTVKHPFVDKDVMLGMDLQLNIYAINNKHT